MAKEFLGQEYVAATNGKGLHQDSRGARITTRVTVTVSVVMIVISIMMVAFCTLFVINPIKGPSMMTTLNATPGKNTDSAITCSFLKPQPGDIVIMKLYFHDTYYANYSFLTEAQIREEFPNYDEQGYHEYVIKRLIAVGGDVITMSQEKNQNGNDDYYLYRNGVRLEEPYLDPIVSARWSKNFTELWKILHGTNTNPMCDWKAAGKDCVDTVNHTLTIPEGFYFVMGDNRGAKWKDKDYSFSWDSIYWGPIAESNFVGKCVEVVYDTDHIGNYIWDKVVQYLFFGWLWNK